MKKRREQDGLWVQEIFSRMKTEYSAVHMMQEEMMAAQIVQLLILFIRNIRLQKKEHDL